MSQTFDIIINASHSSRIAKDLSEFANLSLPVCRGCCSDAASPTCPSSSGLVCRRVDNHWITHLRYNPFGAKLPSPTILRAVSGIAITNSTKYPPLTMTRNQKTLRQQRNLANRPPITGPSAGATITPAAVGPIYFPSSAVVVISALTTYPNATVPLLPALWIQRRTNSAANLFCKAKPMLAAV